MNDIKALNIRLPKELWSFAKKKGTDREMSMNQIIIELLNKYKKKCENKLTDCDTEV